ncbi:low temperature requirement protein A [Nocardia sp. NPDC050717]|uniref:low temperature requirement protein A n=1 Tax=Nocardia sp. NPDC050717 TaxID=3157221 RepID=UPI0033D81C40
MAATQESTEERRASWTELFFDLVAVAGIGQLTHLLHRGPSLGEFGLYVVLYLAFWVLWACVTVYSNVAGEQARTTLVFGCMFGLCVMMAAVAGMPDEHATVFAAIYVLVRVASSAAWGRGQVLVDWPRAQLGAGTLPWIVSLWVPAPWKFVLWAVGLGLDLWVMFAVDADRLLADAERRVRARLRRRRAGSARGRREPSAAPRVRAVRADPAHFGFVPRMMSARADSVEVGRHRVMGTHCALSGTVATVAAGLGLVAAHPSGHLPAGIGWVLGGGAAAFFLVCGLGGLPSAGARWLLRRPVPCLVVAVALAWAAPRLGGVWLVIGVTLLAAAVVSETVRARTAGER